MLRIIAVDKIEGNKIKASFSDSSYAIVNAKCIKTRKQAIALCIELTKVALKKEGAFEKLGLFFNEYSQLRNYEIEDYLDFLNEDQQEIIFYRILENCPFNGFSFFDEEITNRNAKQN